MNLRIFISYASEDRQSVREIAFKLEEIGFRVWIDEDQLLPGQDWQLEIEKAVETTDIVIICLTKASTTKRGFVQKEIKKALDIASEYPEGTIFIIPARLEECEVPHALKSKQWVDMFLPNGIEKLTRALVAKAKQVFNKSTVTREQDELDGIYSAIGNNDDGTSYNGQVIIKKQGSFYSVIWHIGSERYQAKGTRVDDRFFVKGDFNFSYRIHEDYTLSGEWKFGAYEKLTKNVFPVGPLKRFSQ